MSFRGMATDVEGNEFVQNHHDDENDDKTLDHPPSYFKTHSSNNNDGVSSTTDEVITTAATTTTTTTDNATSTSTSNEFIPWDEDEWTANDYEDAHATLQQHKEKCCIPSTQLGKHEFLSRKKWDIFYQQNSTNFFKDRHYTIKVFPELLDLLNVGGSSSRSSSSGTVVISEVGCGVGNAIFPLIEHIWRQVQQSSSGTDEHGRNTGSSSSMTNNNTKEDDNKPLIASCEEEENTNQTKNDASFYNNQDVVVNNNIKSKQSFSSKTRTNKFQFVVSDFSKKAIELLQQDERYQNIQKNNSSSEEEKNLIEIVSGAWDISLPCPKSKRLPKQHQEEEQIKTTSDNSTENTTTTTEIVKEKEEDDIVMDIVLNQPIRNAVPWPSRSITHCQANITLVMFCLSAIHPDKMSIAVKNIANTLRPPSSSDNEDGGILLFRDYGRYDEAQMKLASKPNKLLGHDHFYLKQNGTKCYYFSLEDVHRLFCEEAKLQCIDVCYIRRKYYNRRNNDATTTTNDQQSQQSSGTTTSSSAIRRRVWVQGRFRRVQTNDV